MGPPVLPLPGGRDASTGLVGMIVREVILRGGLFLSPPRWAPPRGVLASLLELVDGSYVVADVRSTSEHLYAIATLAAFWGTVSLLPVCVCTTEHRCGFPPHSGPPAMVPAMGCAALPPLMPCGRGADAECVVYRLVVGCAIAAP